MAKTLYVVIEVLLNSAAQNRFWEETATPVAFQMFKFI
jgi:hypothetical protein